MNHESVGPSDPASIEAYYESRIARLRGQEDRLARRDAILTHVRLGLFLLSAGLVAWGFRADSGSRPWWTAGGVVFVAFVGAIAVHERVEEQLQDTREVRRMNAEYLARYRRDWDRLPLATLEDSTLAEDQAAMAVDLDLFGRASLFHFLCAADTSVGLAVLREWLVHPASPSEARRRQEAVRRLRPLSEYREALTRQARRLSRSRGAPERLMRWAESEPWLAHRPWLARAAWLLPASAATSLGLMTVGAIPAPLAGAGFTAVLLVQAVISVLFAGRVHDIYATVSTRDREARRYRRLFGLLAEMPLSCAKLEELRRDVTQRGGGAIQGFRALDRIVWLSNTSLSSLKFLLHVVLQITLLWDFHVLALLERWQRRYGPHVRSWMRALGETEALASFAGLWHDHPAWTLPTIAESATILQARELGHPLLAEHARVTNDVELGPPGTFLLVTGSNMSGKSTLLRSLGINLVLAQAGAPVCAAALSTPPLILETSMRIRDSLADGVSFYMAELRRLKQVVDRAEQTQGNGRVLYLLDEILQGTNSRERHIAVVRVIRHLLECGAIGAVSTHDVELAASEPLREACRAVHFQETLHGSDAARPLTFDYKLRAGVATTTNALRLLELVGLDRPGPRAPHSQPPGHQAR